MPHSVYRLQPNEYKKYRKHLMSLEQEGRYTRFGYAINDTQINRLCDRFEKNTKEHIIFVIENDDLEVIAAGHISLEGGYTELAFSVLKEYRKQKMGEALIERCIQWCQNRNIKKGNMVCLSSNIAIKRLASKHGLLETDGPESFANIEIPNSNPYSYMNEMVDNHLSNFSHYGKLQKKFIKTATFSLLF